MLSYNLAKDLYLVRAVIGWLSFCLLKLHLLCSALALLLSPYYYSVTLYSTPHTLCTTLWRILVALPRGSFGPSRGPIQLVFYRDIEGTLMSLPGRSIWRPLAQMELRSGMQRGSALKKWLKICAKKVKTASEGWPNGQSQEVFLHPHHPQFFP